MVKSKEQDNSVMHDATPSWNGFNYQGKVGIYVVLTLILEFLRDKGLDSEGFQKKLERYSIQYEWIEDFSILAGDKYVSHHQVKHKEGTAFSTHVKALAQIRSRNKRVLQESDLKKYITITAENPYSKKIEALQKLNCLSSDNALLDCWNLKIDKTSEYYLCLKEFDDFSSRAFSDSKVYFHTTGDVSPPIKEDMSDYPDVPEYLKKDFQGKTKLEELEAFNIYIGAKNTNPYKVVQTDKDLESEIKSLINQLLEKIHDSEFLSITEIEKEMYYSVLQRLVHDHILYRHGLIREKNNIGNGYLEERPTIAFEDFWNVLKNKWKNLDKEYFEVFCQKRFYITYEKKLKILLNTAKRNKSPDHYSQYERLKNYVEEFISHKYKERYRHLFRELAPNLFLRNKETEMLFYSALSDGSGIDQVFLTFLARVIISRRSESILIHKKNKKYYPSTVNLSADDEWEEQEKVIEFQQSMTELNENRYYTPNPYLQESNFFVVNSKLSESVDKKTFELRKITDCQDGHRQTITGNKIYLKHYKDALKEINKDDD